MSISQDLSIKYSTNDLIDANLAKNFIYKGFSVDQPTPGCTYVMQPPKEYQEVFQELQQTMQTSGCPTSYVRIPHATVIAAKVIDRCPNQSWKDLESVQRIYRSFFLFHVNIEMEKNSGDYESSLMKALIEQEGVLANIALATTEAQALEAIKDPMVREQVNLFPFTAEKYQKIKAIALAEINETSFELKVREVRLTNNGSITMELINDERLLRLRMNLIIAGQGISKWPKLSVMKNAWSVIGYITRAVSKDEKENIDRVLKGWTEKNQEKLMAISAHFDIEHLGLLAFRSNDFHFVKKALFPLAKRVDIFLDLSRVQANEEDLLLTPHAQSGGITPIRGERSSPEYIRENWNRVIDEEVK